LSGCLQRGVPEKEAPAHSLVRSSEEGLSDAGGVEPCPETLLRSVTHALMQDGGVPRRGRSALGIVTYPFIFRPVVTRDGGQAPADAGPEEASL
jgi:hypothetical protein